MLDINGKQLRAGQVVVIEGGFYKSDNGTFRVVRKSGNKSYSLIRLNKNGTTSKAKDRTKFYPISVTVNGRNQRIKARKHNDENATIEILSEDSDYVKSVREKEEIEIETLIQDAKDKVEENGGSYHSFRISEILDELNKYGIEYEDMEDLIMGKTFDEDALVELEKEVEIVEDEKVETSIFKLQVVRDKDITYTALGTKANTPLIFKDIAFDNLEIDKEAEEVIYLYTLDSKLNITGIFEVSRGSIDTAIMHPREVFKRALMNNASNVVILHNHPSGDASPSDEDVKVTHRMEKAGELLGVRVLDHVITGFDGEFTSLRADGYMTK